MEGQDNLNPRYIKTEVEVKIEAITKEIIRLAIGQTIDQTVGIEDSSGKIEVDTDLGKVTGEVTSEIIPEVSADKIAEESIGISYRSDSYDRSRNRSRERLFSGIYGSNRTSRSRSGSRASTNRDRIRCYNCREYYHFARDCPTSRGEREIEQLQQMLNQEEDQTSLMTNTQRSPAKNPRASPLNL